MGDNVSAHKVEITFVDKKTKEVMFAITDITRVQRVQHDKVTYVKNGVLSSAAIRANENIQMREY